MTHHDTEAMKIEGALLGTDLAATYNETEPEAVADLVRSFKEASLPAGGR